MGMLGTTCFDVFFKYITNAEEVAKEKELREEIEAKKKAAAIAAAALVKK